MENFKEIIVNGYNISYIYTFNATKPNKKLALLIHGFGSDKSEKSNFEILAKELLKHNIDSIRFDLIGHGSSSGDTTELTINKGLNIIDKLLKNYSHPTKYLIGASYGGTLAVLYAEKASPNYIDKIILWSPLLDLTNNILCPQNHFCKDFLGLEALNNIKKDGYSQFGINGPKFNMNLYDDALKYSPEISIKNIKCKIKIFHGDKDIIVPLKQSQNIVKNSNIGFSIIKNGTHCFYNDESNIQNVIYETIKFLN